MNRSYHLLLIANLPLRFVLTRTVLRLHNLAVCCANWCGFNTIINNPQYFLFTPNQPDVEINIHVEDCTNGPDCKVPFWMPAWIWCNVLTCRSGMPPGGNDGSGNPVD
jgi:hypothetical protein